ncbi:5'/3'-nucleotidase SurE [Azotosporobacter soli]|uniref:5'/3'-nucleotidase SurE n=1 Tax=Azotosporobacter soli TaxID=3055040 RepID=UPI0031FEB49E
MKILLTNDDGIQARGIQALWQELATLPAAEITIAAPDRERSAMSQAITMHHPIRVDEYPVSSPNIKAWSIGGTPADCVKIAIEALMKTPPDLVISGINHGPNLGTDVLYSGTVSAAIEGALHGLPAIAVSLDSWQSRNFSAAVSFIRALSLHIHANPLPPNTLLNVNVPALEISEISGMSITKLGVRKYENIFERRSDPRGRTYYWMGGNLVDNDNDDDSDIVALQEGRISVTPIHFDLTSYDLMSQMEQLPNILAWNKS